jgi:hypothetical protein
MSEWKLSSSHEELFRTALTMDQPLDALRDIGAWVAKYRVRICDHQYQSDGRCAFCLGRSYILASKASKADVRDAAVCVAPRMSPAALYTAVTEFTDAMNGGEDGKDV